MDPSTIIEVVNRKFGTSYYALDRFVIGEQGAFLIADANEKQYVLKWSNSREGTRFLKDAMHVTQRLKNVGYVLPLYIHIGEVLGGVYTIQERLPGHTIQSLDQRLLPKIIELNMLQMDQIDDTATPTWSSFIIHTTLNGGDGYCLPDSLESYSSASKELRYIVRVIASSNSGIQLRSHDIVHFDMNPGNILVHDGQISGIIDWQGPRAGDCAFDLITIMYYSYAESDVFSGLWKHAVGRVGFNASCVYLAHMIQRQVDWSIRHYDKQQTDHWIHVSKRSLKNCGII